VVLLGVCAVFLWPPKEPSYQGKELSEWLGDLDDTVVRDWMGRFAKREQAGRAIRQMGTNVIPYLLRDLRREDTAGWRDKLVLLSRRQSLVRLNWKTAKEQKEQKKLAASAFEALGPLGKGAIPELNQLLLRDHYYAAKALAGIGRDGVPSLVSALGREEGPYADTFLTALIDAIDSEKISRRDAAAALPFALSKLTNTNVPVRGYAALLIGRIRLEPELCVPVLTKHLQDIPVDLQNTGLDLYADILGSYGADARSAIPALIRAEASSDSMLRSAATNALSRIRASIEAREKVPKLVESLASTNLSIRIPTIEALGHMYSNAGAAVPGLIACLSDSDFEVRYATIESLGKIAAKPEQTVPALRSCLRDENKDIRLAAAVALRGFGWEARSCVPELLEAARLDAETRVAIIRVIWVIDPEAAMRVESK
jgi:HEAT repeat protein